MIKNFLLKIWYKLTEKSYFIGFLDIADLELSNSERHSKTKWLKLDDYNKGWFADPFILSDNGTEIEVLAEEFVYSLNRGVISHLLVRRENNNFVLASSKIILQLPTHLSFPNYIIDSGKIYVYPENYESGSLYIYEYDRLNSRLINPQMLINAPLVDSAIVYHEGFYYLFGTINNGTGLDTTKKVEIYKAETLLGEYKHIQTITNTQREERGAGAIYKDDSGRLVRPIQCCNSSYGESLKLKQLIFSDRIFERDIKHFIPAEGKENSLCLHTFNIYGDLVSIDGQDFLYPLIAKKICPFILKFVKLLKRYV